MTRLAALLWPAPYSLVGLAVGLVMVAFGGSARRHAGCLEFAWRASPEGCGRRLRACPFRAITLGHVIVAITSAELGALRAHEHVHVRQYERWGPFFGPAYLAASAWQLLRGGDAYRDNRFEVEARRLAD